MPVSAAATINRTRLLFAGALSMIVYAGASAVISTPPSLRVGALKCSNPGEDVRPSNAALLGKEVKSVTPQGRPNVFDFPKPVIITAKTDLTPPPIEPPSQRILPPDPPGDSSQTNKPTDEKIIRKDLPVRFHGIFNGDRAHFSDKTKPERGTMEFKVGDTIPDYDFKIVRATMDSVILRTPQGEMVELVLFMGKPWVRPSEGGQDKPLEQSSQGKTAPDAPAKK